MKSNKPTYAIPVYLLVIQLIAFMLLLVGSGLDLKGMVDGYENHVIVPGLLFIFGGSGTIMANPDGPLVPTHTDSFPPNPFGIIAFVLFFVLFVSLSIAIGRELKKKNCLGLYIFITVLAAVIGLLLIISPIGFLFVYGLQDAGVKSTLGIGWIFASLLLLLFPCSGIIFSVISKKVKDEKRKEQLELLKSYKALLDSGVITKEEYDKKTDEILDL